MIPRAEINAWRPHAPWTQDYQVEQDLLLTRCMMAIYREPALNGAVAMRGGTVLHKVHLAPAARYAEDIDLVLVGASDPRSVRSALIRVLRPLLGEPASKLVHDVQLAVRNFIKPSRIAQLVYPFAPTSRVPPRATIKVEVNLTENRAFLPYRNLTYGPPLPEGGAPVALLSYDLDEMLGTKMRALLQRTQGRDLFDLWHAWHCHERGVASAAVDPVRVVSAFRHYMAQEGITVSFADFEASMARKLAHSDFPIDMDNLVRDDIKYDVAEAADLFRSVFMLHLP